MDAGMKQFLDDRKINLEQMARASADTKSLKELREMAIRKSVSQPLIVVKPLLFRPLTIFQTKLRTISS